MCFSLNIPFCVVILLLSVSVIPLTFAQVAPHVVFQSPKQQLEQGWSADLVKCNDGLILIKKISNSSPACVKTQTAQKLVERGWGIIVSSLVPNPTPTSCPKDQTMVDGQCVTGVPPITPTQECKEDTLIHYS